MKKAFLAIAAAVLLPSAAFAASDSRIEGGVYFPVISAPVFGTWTQAAGTSMAIGGYGYYTLNSRLALGLEMAYDFDHPTILNSDITIFRLSPLLKFGMGDTTMFGKPAVYYSVVGLGYYHSAADGVSSNDIGFSIGEGVGVEFSQDWLAGVEVRWHHIFSDPAENNFDFMPKLSHRF